MEEGFIFGGVGVDVEGFALSCAALVFFLVLYRLFVRTRELNVLFSGFFFFKGRRPTIRERLAKAPSTLYMTALALLLLALADPYFLYLKEPKPEEEWESRGLALYLLLDNSTSMNFKVPVNSSSGPEQVMKMDLSKRVAKQFIQGDPRSGLKGRAGDMVGLVTFARIARIISPLTLDHEKIVEEIDKIEFNKDIRQVGTGIGYAIYKTVSSIKALKHFSEADGSEQVPFYDIKNPVLIIITDGINEINPEDANNPIRGMDLWNGAEYAKENGVKLYIVNIDPSFAKMKDKTYHELYDLITKYTGGKFYMVDDSRDLVAIYRDIDQLEKSKIPLFAKDVKEKAPPRSEKYHLYPYLIALALLMIFSAALMQATYLRIIP
ncbi:vWA domain-containing protein [Estrella lausannensis]|uniref:Conserved putative membrane protein n=1 Tax=Estrella lausannensis TaxID=483423 RepID=A0A0H5DQT9_9BACT|nr:VWA domain-containing protein [Estrella lausannensis]CRX38922.1 Conserved putative membrane protein [Estrella lausannensis]